MPSRLLEELLLPPLPKIPNEPIDPEIVKALKKASYADIYSLPCGQMKRLNQMTRQARKEKYSSHSHESRYRGVVRIPTKTQLMAILFGVKSDKVRLCFKIMAARGLRPNEVVRLKKDEIIAVQYEGKHEISPVIKIHNTKCDRIEYCAIPVPLYHEIVSYIERYRLRILTHGGYLFYSTNSENKKPHISTNYLRNTFRKACKRCGFNQVYAEVKNPQAKSGLGHRHNLTLYSLRHFAITTFYNTTKDIKLAQLFARHESASTTLEHYINKHEAELVQAINQVFKQNTLFNI